MNPGIPTFTRFLVIAAGLVSAAIGHRAPHTATDHNTEPWDLATHSPVTTTATQTLQPQPDGIPLRVPVSGTTPQWIDQVHRVGAAADTASRHITLDLGAGNPVDAVEASRRVENWLRRSGLHLDAVDLAPSDAHNRATAEPDGETCVAHLTAHGTVADVRAAFRVTIGIYQLGHRLLLAPDHDVTVPGGLHPVIDRLTGIADPVTARAGTNLPAADIGGADGPDTAAMLVPNPPMMTHTCENHATARTLGKHLGAVRWRLAPVPDLRHRHIPPHADEAR